MGSGVAQLLRKMGVNGSVRYQTKPERSNVYLIYMVVMAEFTFQGKEAITKGVTKTGTGAHVFVPKDWLGEEVAIIRLDQD